MLYLQGNPGVIIALYTSVDRKLTNHVLISLCRVVSLPKLSVPQPGRVVVIVRAYGHVRLSASGFNRLTFVKLFMHQMAENKHFGIIY